MANINKVFLKHTNNTNINFPTIGYVKLSELYCEEELNRSEYEKHTLGFVDKISSMGFMDVIKVFPKDDRGYKICEATHRYRGLKVLFETEDPVVPIAILDWKDVSDEEDVKETFIQFNTTGKTWSLFDYVKSNSNTKYFDRAVRNLWVEIRDNMMFYKKAKKLSNSVIAGLYTGELMNQKVIKDTKLAKNFRLTNYDRKVVDLILTRIDSLVSGRGNKSVTHGFLRLYVNRLRRLATKMNDFSEFELCLHRTLINVKVLISNSSALPTYEEVFEPWFKQAITIPIGKVA